MSDDESGLYENHGGTVLAVAGDDYCVVGADTRMSQGYKIMSRVQSKAITLSKKCVLVSSGGRNDITTLHKVLKYKITSYEEKTGTEISTESIAQLLSNTLYSRRFFPYYAFNILGGLDNEGRGCVFRYDAVGSFEKTQYGTSGTGTELIEPLLDSVVGYKNKADSKTNKPHLPALDAANLVIDAMRSAGERDIYTGDFVDVFVVTKDAISHERHELKFD